MDCSFVRQFDRRKLLGVGATGLATLAGCAGVLGSSGPQMADDWTTRVPRTTGGLAAQEGTAYVATADGLETVDVETGDQGWEFSTGNRNASTRPVVTGDTVYVGTFAGPDRSPRLYAISTGGVEAWSVGLPGGVTTPAVTDRTVFAASGVMGGADGLSAFDAASGDEAWSVSLDDHPVGSSPVVAGETVYLESGGFAAFDAATGDLEWRREREETEIGEAARYGPVVGDDTVYFSYSMGTEVDAFDRETGERQWTAEVNARATQPVLADGTLYVGTTNYSPDEPDGRLYALDPSTGDELWSVSTGDVPLEGPVHRDGTVYTAGFDTLYAVQDGKISWRERFDNEISAPVPAGEHLLLDTPTGDSHTLYGLR